MTPASEAAIQAFAAENKYESDVESGLNAAFPIMLREAIAGLTEEQIGELQGAGSDESFRAALGRALEAIG